MRTILAAFLIVALLAPMAGAGTLLLTSDVLNSSNQLAAFTGSIVYDDEDTLTITLTNITPAGGGVLAGFAFNIIGDAIALLVPNPTGDFEDLGTSLANNATQLSPYGDFEFGAALDGNLNGTNPHGGIAVGDTATFVFHVTDGEDLTVQDFFSNTPDTSFQFVARFRAITIGAGSDKVPAYATYIPSVPLPPAIWSGLSVLGLMGVFSLKRKLAALR